MYYCRAAAALCLLLCSSGTGLYLANRLHRRAASLQQLTRLCVRLEGLLGMKLPTGVLTAMLVEEKLLPAGDPWESLRRYTGPGQGACRELAALIGRGDAESQIAAVRLIETGLLAQERLAREEARAKGRLYSTLGVLGGLLAAVLCI